MIPSLKRYLRNTRIELFERDGRRHGLDKEHWLEAGEIVKARHEAKQEASEPKKNVSREPRRQPVGVKKAEGTSSEVRCGRRRTKGKGDHCEAGDQVRAFCGCRVCLLPHAGGRGLVGALYPQSGYSRRTIEKGTTCTDRNGRTPSLGPSGRDKVVREMLQGARTGQRTPVLLK
jgi:hypothetical protein